MPPVRDDVDPLESMLYETEPLPLPVDALARCRKELDVDVDQLQPVGAVMLIVRLPADEDTVEDIGVMEDAQEDCAGTLRIAERNSLKCTARIVVVVAVIVSVNCGADVPAAV